MADIIELLERRDEQAVEILRNTYTDYCLAIISRLLDDPQEAEEALNDVWFQIWNSIPPARPRYLKAYLAKTARNMAINRIRHDNRAKRSGATLVLDELADCIQDRAWEDRRRDEDLREALNSFLYSLPETDRKIFIRRYWFGETVPEIAKAFRQSESRVTGLLHRLRKKLRKYLEQEGLQV